MSVLRLLWLGLLAGVLAATSATPNETRTAASNHVDIEPLDSPPVKPTEVVLQDRRPDVHGRDQDRRDDVRGGGDQSQGRKPEHRGRGEHLDSSAVTTATTKHKQQDLQTAGSSPFPYGGYPGLVGGAYEHYGSPYEPVASHYGDVYHEHFTGHALEDEHHERKYNQRDLAMSFLAYLAVLSILQGGLIALTKSSSLVGVIPGRRRRDLAKPLGLTRVPTITLPPEGDTEKTWLLSEGREIQCIQHSVCDINSQLAQELGTAGRLLGQYISQWAARSVDSGWKRLVTDAGQAGITGEDCGVLYRGCRDATAAEH